MKEVKKGGIKRVRLLPEQPSNHTASPQPRPLVVRKEIGLRNGERFGVFVSGEKAVDMDALTKRIKRKGSGPFQRVLTEVFAEIPPGHENGVLLTTQQVARMFQVTPMTIYDWRKRFALPTVQLSGGRKPPVRYDEGVLLKWAEIFGKKVMRTDYHDWC